MKLWFTNQEYQTLLENGRKTAYGDDNHIPVVKLFTPDANATWLLTDIVPPDEGDDPELAFGLCDLGLGHPELGYVSLAELSALRGRLNQPVEKDEHFHGSRPILDYVAAARAQGRIVEDLT